MIFVTGGKVQLNGGDGGAGAELFPRNKLGFNVGQHVQLKRGAAGGEGAKFVQLNTGVEGVQFLHVHQKHRVTKTRS